MLHGAPALVLQVVVIKPNPYVRRYISNQPKLVHWRHGAIYPATPLIFTPTLDKRCDANTLL